MSDAKPSQPFEVVYRQAGPGETQLPPVWSVPFDETYRPADVPNFPAAATPGYASLGYYMTRNAINYIPPYRVIEKFSFKSGKDAADLWARRTAGKLVVTDRIASMAVLLESAASDVEGAIAWFVRECPHESAVLCLNRAERIWYVEAMRETFVVYLDENNTEIPDEMGAQSQHYLTDQHPNAIMIKGE